MKRNLIYHIWPSRLGEEQWKWNIQKLSEYIHVFNHKIIIGVSLERGNNEAYQTNSMKDVVEEFTSTKYAMGKVLWKEGRDIEFIAVDNFGHLRECSSFYHLLRKVWSFDKDEITFFAHAKGVRWQRRRYRRAERVWTAFMMEQNLTNIPFVESRLREHACFGSIVGLEAEANSSWFNKADNFYNPKRFTGGGENRVGWFYDGSFFWFNNNRLFSSDNCWDSKIMEQWNGIEWYLCNNFSIDEVYDNTKEEYHPFLYRWKDVLGEAPPQNQKGYYGGCYDLPWWNELLEKYPEAVSWNLL